jgi:DNA (cytosine-5)-methyltransferase 1
LDPVVAVDTDATALAVYKRNFPEASALDSPIESVLDGDLGARPSSAEREFIASVGTINLLVGGPPCQGHSSLNNHTRRDDPKNRLYERMARFAELFRPKHIIIENVSAVLHDRGRVVDRTVSSLVRLGYMVDQHIVDVATLGVPQRRRRHVLVASLGRKPNVAGILASYAQEPRTVGWAIGDLLRTKPSGPFDTAGVASKANQKRIDYLVRQNVHDLPDRLRPDCHKLKEHSYKSVYGRMYWDQPAQTITSGFTCMGQGRYVHPKLSRTLTPHEAARLQSIPDFFRFGSEVPRTALSNLIGNAVPPKLTYVLALDLLR